MTINIIQAQPEHAHYHHLLREADKKEMAASNGFSSFEGLNRSLQVSEKAWVGFNGHTPFGFWGVAKIEDRIGSPWFLGTDTMMESSKTVAHRTRFYVNEFFENYDFLYNYVHEENVVSMRWLKWIGFVLEEPKPYGIKGDMFRRFMLSKEDWRKIYV